MDPATDTKADPTAWAIIEAAHELVMARAEKISDPLWRRTFLENVPSNRAVVERWRGIHAPASAARLRNLHASGSFDMRSAIQTGD